MHKINLLLLAAYFFVGCHSQKENNKTAEEIDKYLAGQSAYYRFNGNVLVAENGKIVFQKSYGYANFDTKRLLNDSTVFELASVSKQFTATAILLLKDKGKLKLTDSLRQYFPDLPYHNISIYHMLTHTSGLPDYEEAMNKKWDRSKIAFNKDMIAFLAKEKPPVSFAAGTKWEYSNTAYAILASIVEKVSGQSFHQFMAENIFRPLQMNHTRIYNTRRSLKDTIPNYAYGFVYEDSLQKYFMPDSVGVLNFVVYLDGIMGDGVVNSTTSDLLKWDRAIKNHSLLSEATQNDMLKEQALADTVNNKYYGFGLGVENTGLGHLISHSGGWPGYITYLARIVEKDQTYIVLSNNASASPAIATALQQLMNGNPVTMPTLHKAVPMDSITMQQFVGKYKSTNEINIERKGDKLYRVNPNGQRFELIPASATMFFYSDGSDRQIEFEMAANARDAAHQKVTKVWFINYGVKTSFDSIP